MMSEGVTHATIEAIARNSYGQLIAYIAARSGDVAEAEDALSEAFVSALEKWPVDGVPEKPEAWLLRVARNRVIDAARHHQVRQKSEEFLRQIAEEAESIAEEREHFPDERLKLLFVCAHPAIDPAARTPLMLQTVLGIDAARIASAFLVSPAAMSQRLVRAKNKIRDAAIPFRVPEPPEWEERTSFVLDAIYSAYTTGWESVMETSATHHALAGEAISIGRTVVQLMPNEPEARGLLALMLHCEARGAARYAGDGEFVPLDRQDPNLWSHSLMKEAEEHLRTAAACKRMGRYQLEAAIQSIHANRARTGIIDWPEILLLYEGLVRISPGVGALVGRAVALAQTRQHSDGLTALEEIPAGRTNGYQPYWAARGHILQLLNREEEAQRAFTRAASLTDDPALREYLLRRAAEKV
ncbi:MAG TPA: sigma-70 family RNA polymerase sigma factor [Candidatus Binatia bacterium]|jgi:RNA polymerase sigma factor (sigma-70 family)|nr:sigma-70 family RNA polymerase sigma factor [Candidatus Binatia bacterium]